MLKTFSFVLLIAFCDAQSGKVGGAEDIEPYDETAAKLLNSTISLLDTADDGPLLTVTILKITRQVVAGELYTYSGIFKMPNSQDQQCIITIYLQSWLPVDERTQIQAECVTKTYQSKNFDM